MNQPRLNQIVATDSSRLYYMLDGGNIIYVSLAQMGVYNLRIQVEIDGQNYLRSAIIGDRRWAGDTHLITMSGLCFLAIQFEPHAHVRSVYDLTVKH